MKKWESHYGYLVRVFWSCDGSYLLNAVLLLAGSVPNCGKLALYINQILVLHWHCGISSVSEVLVGWAYCMSYAFIYLFIFSFIVWLNQIYFYQVQDDSLLIAFLSSLCVSLQLYCQTTLNCHSMIFLTGHNLLYQSMRMMYISLRTYEMKSAPNCVTNYSR